MLNYKYNEVPSGRLKCVSKILVLCLLPPSNPTLYINTASHQTQHKLVHMLPFNFK